MKLETIGRIVRNQPADAHVYVREDVLAALKKLYPADDYRKVHMISRSDLENGLSICDVEVVSPDKHEMYLVLDEAVLQAEKELPGYFRFLASLVSFKDGRKVDAYFECVNSKEFVKTRRYINRVAKDLQPQ